MKKAQPTVRSISKCHI